MHRLVLAPPPRLGFTLLLLLGLGLLGLQWLSQSTVDSHPSSDTRTAQAQFWTLSQQLATHQQTSMAQIHARLRALGGFSSVSTMRHDACGRLLAQQLETLPGVDNLLILNRQHSVRCQAQPLGAAHLKNVSEIAATLIQQPSPLPIPHAKQLWFAAPLLGPAGEVEGQILALAPLANWLHPNHIPQPTNLSLTLLDQTGKIWASNDKTDGWLRDFSWPPQAGVATRSGRYGLDDWQATIPLTGAASGLTLVARQTAPNAFLDSTTTLVALLGLSLLMVSIFARRHVAYVKPAVWIRRIAHQLNALLSAHSLQRVYQFVSRFTAESTVAQLRRSNAELKHALAVQETTVRQLQQLDHLNQMLLNSTSLREAAKTVAQCAQDLLPHIGGALLLRTRPGVVEKAISWGACTQQEFSRPSDCWAQRLGYTYVVSQPPSAVCCTHLSQTDASSAYVCVPLIAQGELLGTLHLQSAESHAIWLAEALAQHSAGAISRIQREALLRARATRDPLTGLHNRRFLEEALTLEQTRAKRHGTPIGLMVLDVDHFKRFNDTFGHDAGDALLRTLGRTIRSQVRKGDIPCRYGGEEFVIVLPEADLDITFARAEALRQAVSALQVVHDGQALGPVTLSIGVACYPRHGPNCRSVLKVADQALYAGKHAGRNRVMRPAPMLVSSN